MIKIKRILVFILALVLTFNVFAIFSYAEAPEQEYTETHLEDIIETSSPVRDFEIMFNIEL